MTPWVTSQEADITRRALEAACWLWLGCWSNNVANSHLSPGAFNRRVLRSCLVPQYSHPPYWPRYQRRLVSCDWMLASYTSWQPSCPRRHLTGWASSQCSHIVSSMPCHGAQTFASLSAHLTIGCKCSTLSSPTLAPSPLEWPCQEQPWSGLTVSAPVSDVSVLLVQMGYGLLCGLSVAQKNKPSTMLSSNVQSIDLLMDCTAWRFWTMRLSNGCSALDPKSSAV